MGIRSIVVKLKFRYKAVFVASEIYGYVTLKKVTTRRFMKPWIAAGRPLDPEKRFWEPWKNDPSHPDSCLKGWGSPNQPEKQNKGKRHRTKRVVPWFVGNSALDVGCGLGHLFYHLKPKTEDYLGVDCLPMIMKARTFWPEDEKKFQQGDIFDLSGEKGWGEPCGVYDAVFCLQVVIHLPVLYEPLAQMWEHARRAVVFTVNPPKFSSLYVEPKGLIGHRYSLDEIRSAFVRLKPRPKNVNMLWEKKREFPNDPKSVWEMTIFRLNKDIPREKPQLMDETNTNLVNK